MNEIELRVDGLPVSASDDWHFEWLDPGHGVGRLVGPDGAQAVLAEGSGPDWIVTLRGRRIPVTVRTWRERVLAEAETSAREHDGPVDVRATLPGLVVAVAVGVGDEVEEGMALLTIEAMKMQNEVRAPRTGTVIEVTVSAGQTVATGASLLRLE